VAVFSVAETFGKPNQAKLDWSIEAYTSIGSFIKTSFCEKSFQ